jgi:FkbM family methyltransferase
MKKVIRNVLRQWEKIENISLYKYLSYKIGRRGKLICIELDGQKVWVRKKTPDLNVAINSLTGKNEFQASLNYFPKEYNGVIVDAGGYIGTTTLALRSLFPVAKIIIIEPSLKNLNSIKKNLTNISNIEIIHGALVGSEIKSVELKDIRTGEWGFTIIDNPKIKLNAKKLHDTPAYTLEQLNINLEEIGILKLDIEGGEYDLLKNDLASLKKIPVIYAELHDGIIDGCSELFFEFSKSRDLFQDGGEKYISIKR